MTFDELRGQFRAAYPRAVDFPMADKSAAETVANECGYRLAGVRLERAVFTTKPMPMTPLDEIAAQIEEPQQPPHQPTRG